MEAALFVWCSWCERVPGHMLAVVGAAEASVFFVGAKAGKLII